MDGTTQHRCKECEIVDDENHRLNECHNYKNINRALLDEKINFAMVFSENEKELVNISREIMKIWSLSYGINEMKNVS